MAAPTFESILRDISSGTVQPVYVLHGEEGYYADRLTEAFAALIPEDERDFNLYTLFATQDDPGQIIQVCRRCPVMAPRQIVIVKEMQGARADQLDKLAPYLEAPSPTTVAVFCFRGAVAKGKAFLGAAKKGGAVMLENKKITEYNAPALIGGYIRTKGLSASPKSLEMMRDFIGTDLSRLYNEVDKLAAILAPGAEVTPEVVERYVGVSREYNSFELVDAIAAKDAARCFRILEYFRANPKAVPLVMASATVFNFFSDLLVAHYCADRTDRGLSEALGLRNSFALKRIKSGMAAYNAVKVVEIISAIRRFDVQSKGVDSRQNEHQLFYDLIYRILTASGTL